MSERIDLEQRRQEIIAQQMRDFGVSRLTAEFIAALELGERDGDVILPDDETDDTDSG
jgi:hypothetical protein